MVKHVSSSIQFGLIVSVSVVSFFYMISPIGSYFNHTRVLDMDDGKFSE